MRFWIKLSHQDQLLGSQVWDTTEPLMMNQPINLILDYKDSEFLVTNLATGKLQKAVISESVLEAQNIQISPEYKISVFPLEVFGEIQQSEISKFSGTKYELPNLKYVDPEETFFNKVVKNTYASGSVTMLLMLAIVTFWNTTPEVEELEEQKQELRTVRVKNAPSPSVVAAAYEKAIQKGQTQAAKTEKKPVVARKASTVKSLKNAFSSLIGGGLSAPTRVAGNSAPNRAVAVLPGVENNGTAIGGRRHGAGGSKGDSIVKVAMAGAGNANAYDVGGSSAGLGIGGVDGQGEGFLSLNLQEAFIDEGLSRDEVGRVIHSNISEIRYCYESSMIRKPDLEGKLVVDFTIAASGRVRSANVNKSSVRDERLNECILKRLARWEFPKPKSGVEVAVSYPFIFKRLRR
ncbi:energy transducer TonB [bacterium]|nr:energy transducer TonB [bacterium]